MFRLSCGFMGPMNSYANSGYFSGETRVRTSSIPIPMLLLAAALWILAIITQRFELPWNDVSFTSSYGGALLFCYFLTGLTTMKALKTLKTRSEQWRSERVSENAGRRVSRCSTCQTFGEVTEGFTDMPPKVEAIYIEHLEREHQIEP